MSLFHCNIIVIVIIVVITTASATYIADIHTIMTIATTFAPLGDS
jgi:hypothetical protein